jgi:hypothetical protein
MEYIYRKILAHLLHKCANDAVCHVQKKFFSTRTEKLFRIAGKV